MTGQALTVGPASERPFSILIAALGGEGGGVLMNWIVAAARKTGLAVQATSVPGVAQRTGATSYYIEFTRPAENGPAPVFSLMPTPARVDVVLASELVEAGRMMERGFVSPTRTTLITSTSRTYATSEKVDMGDGRFASDKVLAAAEKLSARLIALDLDAVARENNTMISATLFGALAGSGLLPWSRDVSENCLGSGRLATQSKAGFAAAFAMVDSGDTSARPQSVAVQVAVPLPKTARFPTEMHDIAGLGFERTVDFQDERYGQLYLERLDSLLSATSDRTPQTLLALSEAARRLALWMAYEDTARVADLKTRPERFARIRSEVEMTPGQILHVTEYLKPGVEEVAGMLPVPVGKWLLRQHERGVKIPFLGKGVYLRSTSIFGNLLLKATASLKHIRRRSLRYQEEQASIEAWLQAMRAALARDAAFATALAELPRLLKGYSDTHARGRENYAQIFERIVAPACAGKILETHAPRLRRAISAALADPDGHTLTAALQTLDAA